MRRPANRAVLPVFLLCVIYLLVVAAGFIAPYDYALQTRDAVLSPPTKVHWIDSNGVFHFRPFVYRTIEDPERPNDLQEDKRVPYTIHFAALETQEDGSDFGRRLRLMGVDPPAHLFLLGTDELGRDVFSRLLYGGRISLLAGLFAASLSLGLATILGSIAGFYGSWIDMGIMRIAELFIALPWMYLLLALRSLLPLHMGPVRVFFIVVGLIGSLGWARPTRLVRGVALSLRERHYVLAARSFGASDAYLLRRHILPGIGWLLLTQAVLLVPHYVLAEVTLSFFGLGIGEPTPSWGSMLASLQQYRVLVSAWWMFSPGVAMVTVFLLYRALHDALQPDSVGAEL
jgi:peptide/nickel transport system permease protein